MSKYKIENTIRVWAEDDRPREKFLLKGPSSLSDAELVAIQIGSGNSDLNALDLAKTIISSTGGSLEKLAKLSVEELTNFKGIGLAKAVNIFSAIELGKRSTVVSDDKQISVTESGAVYNLFSSVLNGLNHEEFWVVFLNTSNKVIKKERISVGGLDSTVVDLRIILKRALLLSSSSIILAHNHPSGSLKPSQADLNLTKQIIKACQSINISVLDHLIIGAGKYFSFTDEGLI